MKVLIILNLLVIISCELIIAKKILFILPISTKSQKNIFDPIIEGLASKGHEITVISPLKSQNLPKNVNEIVPMLEFSKRVFKFNPFENRWKGKSVQILSQSHVWTNECHLVYKNQQIVEEIIEKHGPGYFDLIFINCFFNQCLLGLVDYLQAPFIYVTSMSSPLYITRYTGNYFPTSFVPLPFLDLSDKMTFFRRVQNFVLSYLTNHLQDYASIQHQAIYRQYLGNNLPDINSIASNVSLIFSNEHWSLTYARSNLPDTIDIGGIHCQEAKPLPQDLEEFVASSEEYGFIYFSFGSIVQPSHLPEKYTEIFLNVFKRLKQRVIWKWDNETITDNPSNVLVRNWLPQQNILGHKSIKLFITHGGLLSTQEAVYHGVPLLGLPVFVDQDLNMNQAERQGYGLKLEILELNEEKLESSINRLLNEPMFYNKVKTMSKIFRDQKETPLERAIFWAEYVIRHKGAKHLRSAARDLNWFQIHSWDIIGFMVVVLCLVLYFFRFLIKYTLKLYFYMSSTRMLKKKKVE